MLLAVWNCLSIPFTVAFQPSQSLAYELFDRAIDICFAIDIVINFRTTFINSKTGFEVFEWKKIALAYVLGGRFVIDLLASIPFELIYTSFANEEQANSNSMTFQLLGLLKLVRLLRLGRIVRYMKFKQGFKIGMRIVQLLLFLLMLVHWIACIWYLLVKNPEDGWLPPKDLDA